LKTRIVFHVDFDYFYAQCEEIRNPELQEKPVCVCVFSDRGGDSGAIATANYSARKFGVKSGMSINFAKNLLKEQNAVFLPVDFNYYKSISEKAMAIMKKNADVFEYVGKDEAYLDVTKKIAGNWSESKRLGMDLKEEIMDEVHLSCSIGVSPNKLVSKIASDFQKPDGLTIVLPEEVDGFLEPLKIRDIPGIGKKTEKRFAEMNFLTIKDVKKLDVFTLTKEFGRKIGTYIFNSVRGIDTEPVKIRESNIQYSKIITLKKDSIEFEFILKSLKWLCNEVHQIISDKNRMFKSVGVQIIQSDLSIKTKSRMLKNPTESLEELEKNAEQLLKSILEEQKIPIRRIGVKVSELSETKEQSTITNYF